MIQTPVQPKPIEVKIINISTATDELGKIAVFGLGNDGKVYQWWNVHANWVLFIQSE